LREAGIWGIEWNRDFILNVEEWIQETIHEIEEGK
jgi:hypothetical protein